MLRWCTPSLQGVVTPRLLRQLSETRSDPRGEVQARGCNVLRCTPVLALLSRLLQSKYSTAAGQVGSELKAGGGAVTQIPLHPLHQSSCATSVSPASASPAVLNVSIVGRRFVVPDFRSSSVSAPAGTHTGPSGNKTPARRTQTDAPHLSRRVGIRRVASHRHGGARKHAPRHPPGQSRRRIPAERRGEEPILIVAAVWKTSPRVERLSAQIRAGRQRLGCISEPDIACGAANAMPPDRDSQTELTGGSLRAAAGGGTPLS